MAKKHTVIIDDINDGESKELIEKVKTRFDAANQKTFDLIEDFIAGGYEENLVRLMIYLPKEHRAAALQKLPESVREKVSSILNTFSEKKNSDPDVMSAVGTVLKNADFYGEKAAREIIQNDDIYFLSAVESENKNLFEVNPLLSMNVEYYLVNMNVLVEIDDRSIQKWLREVETQDLAKALKETDAAGRFRHSLHRDSPKNLLRKFFRLRRSAPYLPTELIPRKLGDTGVEPMTQKVSRTIAVRAFKLPVGLEPTTC